MALGLGLNTANPPLTRDQPIYAFLHGGLLLSALAVIFILGGPLLRATWTALRRGQITVDSLFMLSVLGAMGGSLVSSLTGVGAVYYEVVAVVLAIYTVGKALGVRTRARAMAEADALEHVFDRASVETPEGRRELPLEQVTAEHTVVVGPGEPIPVDGCIVRGTAYVRELPLTGEPAPVIRREGDEVLAGTHSVDGLLFIRPRALKGERRFDQVLTAVREARERPSHLLRQADRLTRWFVPVVCVVSVGTFVVWLPLAGWSVALFNAMAVIIVACPCALGLATPAAVWSGLAGLARLGLVARTGDLLDNLARVRTVVFDKTGTLSGERLAVVQACMAPDWEGREVEVATALRVLEAAATHPAALALADWAAARGEEAAPELLEARVTAGAGLCAYFRSGEGATSCWRLGRRDFVKQGDEESGFIRMQSGGSGHRVWLSVDGKVAAVFGLEETLREGTEAALAGLRAQGLRLMVLTGDAAPRWERIAGVTVESGLRPADKAARVRVLHREAPPLLFVGDGINDTPAMAEADASIAMDCGADLTQACADGVLPGGRLDSLPQAVALSRSIRRCVAHNLRFALVYNGIGMTLAALGILHPVVAALLMLVSSALVSWRVLRVGDASEAPSPKPKPESG